MDNDEDIGILGEKEFLEKEIEKISSLINKYKRKETLIKQFIYGTIICLYSVSVFLTAAYYGDNSLGVLLFVFGLFPYPIIPLLLYVYIFEKKLNKIISNKVALLFSSKISLLNDSLTIKKDRLYVLTQKLIAKRQNDIPITQFIVDSKKNENNDNLSLSKIETHEKSIKKKNDELISKNEVDTKKPEDKSKNDVINHSAEIREQKLDEIFTERAKQFEEKKREKSFRAIKTDHLEDAVQKMEIGDAGEIFILDYERKQLTKKDRDDLADKVQHVSKELGDGLGYDILSFDENGNEKYIEVKTTTQGIKTLFYMSDNEYNKAISTKNYFIYRVYDFNLETQKGKLYKINTQIDLDKYFTNKPISYQFIPKIK